MVKFTSTLISPLIAACLFIGAVVVADYLWTWQHMTFTRLVARRYDGKETKMYNLS